jgi:outer membrane protein OmpA-like peptidoglycan-associated protein
MKKTCLAFPAALAALSLAASADAAERFPKDYTYKLVGLRSDVRAFAVGTVSEIDQTKRTVTVQDAAGMGRQFKVHDRVANLGQARVTDDVTVEYVRSVRLYQKVPGAKAPAKEVVAALEADVWKTGDAEKLVLAGSGTATVESVNRAARTVVFRGPDGRAYPASVEDALLLEGLAPGQTFDFDVYDAVAVALDVRPKPPPPSPPPPPPPPPVAPKHAKLVEKRIQIDDIVYFGVDKATIEPRSHELLDDVAAVVQQNPQVKKVRIEGNTSKDPLSAKRKDGAAYNRKLSRERADAVKAYLVSKGVDAGRLEAVGFGWDKPIAPNRTEAGRAKNRRVDFVVLDQ